MPSRSIAYLLAAVACLCLPPRGAAAADPPAAHPPGEPAGSAAIADAALTGQARELHSKGVTHFRSGQFDKAYAAFAAAWGIKKYYRIAGPLGACELELGKYREAAEHLRYFLDHLPAGSNPTDRRETEKLFLQAASKVVRLTIRVTPPNASLSVNGATVKAGQQGFYEPGAFQIAATREGYTDVRQTQQLQAGTTQTIALKLVAAAEELPPPPPPPESIDGRLIAGLATGAGALVGFGVGIGATVVAGNRTADVMDQQAMVDPAGGCAGPSAPAACMTLLDAAQARDTALDVSDGAFIAGGVLAASSAGLLLWWALAPDTGDVQVTPSASSDSVSLSIRGTW